MPISCDPSALESASKCFECLTSKEDAAVKTYLLAVLAGQSLDPGTLLNQAKCFMWLNSKQTAAIQTYLDCQIAQLLGA